ncbi:flagellar export protein FliJ [Clostridium estertheticum]|uniref:Flagellar FliJ protein n=1 Tax=Clostridium estertheticum TaxID=238834 RepID=A0A7Y3WSJ5_9CLOT|nr:flagellar export protein FliJ [Clostridium estertheticum]MBW9170657.1 flagellar export protein FliJ [Clostridium estertheticum]MBX4269223.1 flagellar export protein FliJ [Clostridium estertheticum]NNU76063.1 flagellar export protein FliJ [Clostridium estertheticum]WBL46354.1 flagellar export protein FliJ [Clostridium estertheticum]WLC74497.1 flagellar export protein FliJ [Clostridium estertheticum]
MSGAYKFRLQKLLDIRQDFEDKSKLEFKEAQREKNIVENELNNLKEKYKVHRNIDAYESIIQQKIKQNYLNALNYSIDKNTIVLEDKGKILEQKREKLKLCQVEKKTVEILKEKQKISFLKEQNLIEQKSNDEFALFAFIRNNKKINGNK